MALLFVRFDQEDEQVEGIRFGRALPRFVIEVLLDFGKSGLVFRFGANGAVDHRMVGKRHAARIVRIADFCDFPGAG
jgi:hypothetical protein